MGRDFYQILNLAPDASAEEVRRAYRKRALETHPDRRRDGSEATTEEFRKVNNAYEVLSDAAKRASYDAAGRVWPPPEASGSRHPDPHFSRRPDPFDPFSFGRGTHAEPFSRDPFAGNLFFSSNFFMPAPPFGANMFGSGLGPQRAQSGAADPWGLSDPFAQFDRFFAALREDPFMRGTSVPVPPAPFGPGAGSGGGPSVGGPPRGSFGDWSAFDNKPGGSTQMQSSYISSHAGGRSGGGDWVSQSHVTRSVNGVTERIVKRVDRQGNEHITYTRPDGSVQQTLNGRLADLNQQQLPAPGGSSRIGYY